MSRRARWIVGGVALVLVAGLRPSSAGADDKAPAPVIDPQAMSALDRMGAFLRAQKSMKVVAETTTDDVLPSGQKVQYSGTATLQARRPDRLRVDVVSDRKNEQMFYDGTTFTIFQPTAGYYASFKAPPTLAELVNVLEQRYGVDLPLADLFYWGTDKSRTGEIRSATKIGTSTVKGTKCDHFAFRQADIDWEVCIQQGSDPLPRRLVITTKNEPTQPQHTSVMTWTLAPEFDERQFSFTPPANAHQIQFDLPQQETRRTP